LTRAAQPFRFATRLHLAELTGMHACNLAELAAHLETVPDACVYHHTHRFLQQHQYLSPEPPNDFAWWIAEVLGDDMLAELLASIDTVRFRSIADLRGALVSTINGYVERRPESLRRFAGEGELFHFMKTVSFVIPTAHLAYDLGQFADMLGKVTIESVYFHIFEARLRLKREMNDFSYWISSSLGDNELAGRIAALDPYTRTLEDLRTSIIRIVGNRQGE